jgi:hypothetical protein
MTMLRPVVTPTRLDVLRQRFQAGQITTAELESASEALRRVGREHEPDPHAAWVRANLNGRSL